MARDYLGLFDTPPDKRHVRFAVAIVALLFVGLVAVLPVSGIQLGQIEPFVPVIDSIMFASELMIATLLFAQAGVFRSRALTILACGYFFASLLLIPHALTFPGVFTPTGLLGADVNTTAWLATCRRLSFPTAVILYAVFKSADAEEFEAERPTLTISYWIIGSLALAAGATLLAINNHDLLPPLFLDRREAIHSNLIVMNSATILLTVAAMILLLRQHRTLLDLWLLVALSAWLAQSLLNLPLNARFTLGWYGLFGLMLASSVVVMIALLVESNRLYSRLAISASAHSRERNTRQMSIDAVAAAISHEVGQPLAAVNLNASASLGWLTRDKPDVGMAIVALHDTIEAGRLSVDVIKSVRAMSVNGVETLSELNLNDLVRDTASILDRELVAQKVTLEFDLEETAPSVKANRVQIQRVLLNLLTNAAESLAATQGRARRIMIRTSSVQADGVLVEISDTGLGVAPERMAHIFDPFHSSKSAGRGLGLSLSKTIVEEHGGRLWASNHEPDGATFHIELMRSPPVGAMAPAR